MSTADNKTPTQPNSTPAPRKSSRWLILSNGSRVLKDLVGSVGRSADGLRIFIKGKGVDEFLCSVVHDNEDDALAELMAINEQLD